MSFQAEWTKDIGLLWLRVLTGAGIAYHGYGKVFGGYMDRFTEGVAKLGFPMPEYFAWAAAFSEFGGGILLVLGLLTRWSALAVFGTMSVAAFMQHRADPFQAKELALAYWTASGALFWLGAGGWSVDRLLRKK
jgi:putative oxidoreductase